MSQLKTSQHKLITFLGIALTLVVLAACSDSVTPSPALDSAGYRDGNSSFIALNTNNTLVLFGGENSYDRNRDSNDYTFRRVNGVDGRLLGIDYRPANGKLYGLTNRNKLYTIDPYSGRATFVSRLSINFGGGAISGFDFNPVADRLRLTGSNDQNYRVNVDNGMVILDGTLRYDQGDRNQGRDPNVTGSAYTNSVPNAQTTMLYGIDFRLDVLVTQNPANDGLLQTVGRLGVDFSNMAGFDIVSDGYSRRDGSYGGGYGGGYSDNDYTGYAVSNSYLYKINLDNGRAERVKRLPDDTYRGLTVMLDRDNDRRW